MWWLASLALGALSAAWTSSFSILTEIKDLGHQLLPTLLPQKASLIVFGSLVTLSLASDPRRLLRSYRDIYAVGLGIKGIANVLTTLPDSFLGPDHRDITLWTRNDMFISGHTLLVWSAAAALGRPLGWLAVAASAIALVSSRIHYSADVFLACVLGFLLQQRAAHLRMELPK